MNAFEKTLDFNSRMRKPAHKIIRESFGRKYMSITRVESLNDLALDQRAGIDSRILFMPTDVSFSVQEKYRTHDMIRYMDFTQELYNAYRTEYQADGEFKHLHATYYFYGWSNANETDFDEWFIMDIQEYKMLVLKAGGLSKIPGANQHVNATYGKALFYTIPLQFLTPAVRFCSDGLKATFNM